MHRTALMIAALLTSFTPGTLTAARATSRARTTIAPCQPTTPASVGAACYEAIARELVGGAAPLDSLYDAAVRHRTEILAQLAGPVHALLGDSVTVLEGLRTLRTDPRFVMHDPDAILAAYRASVPRAVAAVRPFFRVWPDTSLAVQPIATEQAANSAPAGYSATGDSGATLFVNVHQPGGIATMNVGLGVAHEAYPGHHLQARYAPPVDPRTLPRGAYTFIEGWGIYAERLADEAGFYDTPMQRCGYLVHLLDVFMALQLDIGVHARGLTASQASDTMVAVAGRPRVQADQYTRRHLAMPGQLASYAIGYAAINDARERVQAMLGARFDIAEFHDAVLGGGAIALPQLRERVSRWVAARKAS
jgi:uncharacterized protein (DUF885 family)